jgi:hypothetical protein
MELLLSGCSHSQIQNTIQPAYKIEHGQVEKDIQACYEIIESDYTKNVQQIISKHLAMYYAHRNLALQTGQVGAANQALTSIEKLFKLHSPDTQVNVQNNTVQLPDLSHLSVEELKELLKLQPENK